MEKQITVLIVDDEPVGREALEGPLYAQGYHLIFAENGAQAIDQAIQHLPDLILLDVMMPDMDGFEVCRRLRANPLLADAPILMVTALDDRSARLRGIEMGADDFISKPFDRLELRARVATITRLNRYRRILLEQAKFAWVVEQSQDGYLIIDDYDDILYANPMAWKLLGLPADEGNHVTGKFLELAQKLYHCVPSGSWEHWPLPPKNDDAQRRYLVRQETDQANALWVQVELLDLPSTAASSHLLRLLDVSAQAGLQRETWTFHSMLFHKLHMPLSDTLAGLELLTQQAQSLPAEQISQIAFRALSEVKHLKSQVDDILQYLNSPLLAFSGSSYQMERFSHTVETIAAEIGIEQVAVNMDPRLNSIAIPLSSQALEIILYELLENAKKFHPDLAPQISASATRSEFGELVLQIADDGQTLAPDQLDRVWIPYYQVEKSFTGGVKGMGLGLPMVASIVWAVGGKCRLYNRLPGPGVVIEITLPLAEYGNY